MICRTILWSDHARTAKNDVLWCSLPNVMTDVFFIFDDFFLQIFLTKIFTIFFDKILTNFWQFFWRIFFGEFFWRIFLTNFLTNFDEFLMVALRALGTEYLRFCLYKKPWQTIISFYFTTMDIENTFQDLSTFVMQ